MKMTKLLTGAAVAALLTGAANAQVASVIYQGDTGAPNLSGVPFPGDNVFASEIGSIAGLSVPLEFSIEPTALAGAFTTSPNVEVLLEVTVTNAVFDRSIQDTDIVGTGGAPCIDTELTVDSGGVAGQSTVVFRIADISDCDAVTGALAVGTANPQFALPLLLSGGDVTLTYTMTRAADGSAITSGTFAANEGNATFAAGPLVQGPLITQTSALNATRGTDFAIADVAAAGGAYFAFTGDDTLAAAFTFGYTGVLTNVVNNPAAPTTYVPVNPATDFAASPVTCTFPSGVGLDETLHALGAAPVTASTATSTTFNVNGVIGAQNLVLAETAPPSAGIQPQFVSCSGQVNWSAAPAFAAYSDITLANGTVGQIVRNGVITGQFEWVGDNTLSTRNVFRITGVGAAAPQASVIVTNSSTGLNGEFDITLPAPSNGEIILTEQNLTDAIGLYGRADIQINLHQNPAAANTIAVRRFLVGENGTLTDMGTDNDDGPLALPTGILPTTTPAGLAGGGNN